VLDVLENSEEQVALNPMQASKVLEDVMQQLASDGDNGSYEPDFDDMEDSPDEVEEDIGADCSDDSSGDANVAADANESMDKIRASAAASIDALLAANSQLINAYNKGSGVGFAFSDGYAPGDTPAKAQSENRAAYAPVVASALPAPTASAAPDAVDSKENIFPAEMRNVDKDHFTSVLRSEFKNLWTMNITAHPRAGISTRGDDDARPNPKYFAWPGTPPPAPPARKHEEPEARSAPPPAPVSTNPVPSYPGTGSGTWVTEYDDMRPTAVSASTIGAAGVPGGQPARDPPFFAYPTKEVRLPKKQPESAFTVPPMASEARGSYFWKTDIAKPVRTPQRAQQTPLVHDVRLLDTRTWASEYDACYAQPQQVGLGGIIVTSMKSGGAPQAQADFVLPVPAGGSPNKGQGNFLGGGKKKMRPNGGQVLTPFGRDANTETMTAESSTYGATYTTDTVLIAGQGAAKEDVLLKGAGAAVANADEEEDNGPMPFSSTDEDDDDDDDEDEEYTADPEWAAEDLIAELAQLEEDEDEDEEEVDAEAVAEAARELADTIEPVSVFQRQPQPKRTASIPKAPAAAAVRYGVKGKDEPPLWVHGKEAPEGIFKLQEAAPAVHVTPSVLLPPYAVDPMLLAEALHADKTGMVVVGRALTAREVSRLIALTKSPDAKKGGKKKLVIPKYKSFEGPNRAIKFGDKYGKGQARGATMAATRSYKENRRGKPSAVLFNPRFPRQTDKQSKRWATEANDTYGQVPKRSLK
jgi:hypothetical protein